MTEFIAAQRWFYGMERRRGWRCSFLAAFLLLTQRQKLISPRMIRRVIHGLFTLQTRKLLVILWAFTFNCITIASHESS